MPRAPATKKSSTAAAAAAPSSPKAKTTKAKVTKSPAAKAAGGAKKQSPYNIFMKNELPKFKAKNPTMEHKEAFRQVAFLWKTAKENPKNATAA
ncbi:hypothetical protein H4219_000736 [Mycoemilia scoparia]|uniref:YABBY protein C-terminal domain-containing protein n=1 Tax=Mycoemilia scoparia TaxID=417184 RepID=A0A9W8DRA6_9FUNG|nr:hypothetical protein H4219_000736 [Mycoemilia scoparia]